jgi:hypothetical protein
VALLFDPLAIRLTITSSPPISTTYILPLPFSYFPIDPALNTVSIAYQLINNPHHVGLVIFFSLPISGTKCLVTCTAQHYVK